MKRLAALVLALTLTVCLCGCNEQPPQKPKLIDADNIKYVSVTSLPEGYEYLFAGEDAKAVADYLLKLNLIVDFKENPDHYVGMTWVISLEYENGDIKTVYHAANMFIRTDDGPWYQMVYEEAKLFGTLLNELNNG